MLQVIGYLQNDLKIEKKKIIYIDKERIEFEYISDYKKLFEETKNFDHIFVDEIQNIPQWEKAILNLQNL
jgi:predicted AAA+ superfamily ATPase